MVRILSVFLMFFVIHFGSAERVYSYAHMNLSGQEPPVSVKPLVEQYTAAPEKEKPGLCLYLAYVYHNQENYVEESRWLAAYFELYRGYDFFFPALEEMDKQKIRAYGERMTRIYPYIFDVSLIANALREGGVPPTVLTLHLEVRNRAHYKLSAEGRTIKAGFLKEGQNHIDLEVFDFFRKSGSHVYLLNLKAEHLVFDKEITISEEIQSEIPNEAPDINASSRRSSSQVSLYLGSRLLAVSRKIRGGISEMRFDIPPADLHYRPFIVNDKLRSSPSGIPILAPLALAYQLIQKIREERKGDTVPPVEIEKTHRIERNFRRVTVGGGTINLHVVLTLRTQTLSLPSVIISK
ncbi:MAG: hypothetical protein JXB26_00985 [Candidatus Aminicenantes bacterium]|nr:hypothetical protein [Candidatus Aminicenantes bacterium]